MSSGAEQVAANCTRADGLSGGKLCECRSSGAVATNKESPSLRTGFLGGSGAEMRVAGFVSRSIYIDTGKVVAAPHISPRFPRLNMLGPVQSLVEPLFPLLLREGASVEEGDQLAGGAELHVTPIQRNHFKDS
jgi:hypothetical protein